MGSYMSDRELRIALRGLRPRMERYAELLVREGVNVERGQELVIQAPVEAAAFTRMVVKAGYEAGAAHVTVLWRDDELNRLDYTYVAQSWFETVPAWKREQMNGLAAAGACFLMLDGTDPDVMDGIDPAKVAAARFASNTQCDVWRHAMDFAENAWCIGGVPCEKWAQKVFPESCRNEAMLKLWQTVLDVSRVGEDPVSEWETQTALLDKSRRAMDQRHFDRLHYKSANGTNFTVGLTRRHLWGGGGHVTLAGRPFLPNIPTEEIFTNPDRARAEGIVHSALPLNHGGAIVDRFWLRFEGGRVTDWGAEQGADVLRSILEADDGARRLDEVALISKNTPIRQSGLLFYNTLYDENASCHLALGAGFPDALEGGPEMGEDELLAEGVNRSSTHVDFMVGAEDLDITGITASGEEVPVFINGQWAWE